MTVPVLVSLVLASSAICTDAESIAAGEPASCSGILVPSHEATECISCLSVRLPKCLSNYRYLDQECKINLRALEAAVRVERDRGDSLQAAMVEGLRSPPWYERPAYVFAGGALFGALSTWAVIHHLD